MIPNCEGPYGTMPAGRHQTTLAEIYTRFVEEAPFRPRRELIYRALTLLNDLVVPSFPNARLWIDGGFTTHKTWAEPEDADVAIVVPLEEYKTAISEKWMPLWTLQGVTSTNPRATTARLQPLGRLVDVFFVLDDPAQTAYWEDLWSKVRDDQRQTVAGATKGYLEVSVR